MKAVGIVRKLIVASLSLLAATSSSAEELSPLDRFELWNDCQAMAIWVEGLNQDATDIGLTESAIETAVRSRLRAARIYDAGQGPFLYVNVNVFDQAFTIEVDYWKLVLDIASSERDYTITWSDSWLGTHGEDEGYILSTLSQSMDRFIDEYLRVNANACRYLTPTTDKLRKNQA